MNATRSRAGDVARRDVPTGRLEEPMHAGRERVAAAGWKAWVVGIEEALQRLRDGLYGICAECGNAIAPGRLRALPEATMCVRCQARIEPGQASQKTVRGFYPEPRGGDEPDDA